LLQTPQKATECFVVKRCAHLVAEIRAFQVILKRDFYLRPSVKNYFVLFTVLVMEIIFVRLLV